MVLATNRPERGLWIAAVGCWLLQLVLAVGFGAARQGLLVPLVGNPVARAGGTVALCLGIAWLAGRFVRRRSLASGRRWAVGGLWCVLTLAFEFLAGHFLFRASWEMLLADWNLMAGHLWPLVPATTLLAPVLAGGRR